MLLNRVVIGSTVEAAYYALVNDCHFIPTRKTPPMFYEAMSTPLFGTSSTQVAWSKLNLTLGLLSRKIATTTTPSIRVREDTIKITVNSTVFKYRFEKLFIFDPTNLDLDNEIKYAKERTFTVLDDFELSVLGPKRKTLESFIGHSNFCNQLHFYCSDRVDGADFITDCIVQSELTLEQLNLIEYSDSMVRFFVKRHLTDIGVNGRLMKYYKNGNPKFRKPNVVHVRRVITEKDNNVYRDTGNVKFVNLSIEDIVEESS